MKRTQRQLVLEKLRADGEVSNVWAVQHGIFRLSERIRELKEEGYKIEGDFLSGSKTYQYTLVERPKRLIYQRVEINGVMTMRPQLV